MNVLPALSSRTGTVTDIVCGEMENTIQLSLFAR